MIYDLNEMLGCLFVLVLSYLNVDHDSARHGAFVSPKTYDPTLLGTLENCGLIRFSPEGEIIELTREGASEARGILKFLQLQLGPRMGASLHDILYAHPELYAEEAALGAGPLTTTELVYALAGVSGGSSSAQGFSPALPASQTDSNESEADQGNEPAFVLRVSLPILSGKYYYSPRHECWRTILVPARLTFLDLHLVIQLVFCWKDLQPFGFLLNSHRKNLLIGERRACGEIVRPKTGKKNLEEVRASQLTLGEVFPRTKSATYSYGTAGIWKHDISLVSTERCAVGSGPRLLDGMGDAPPEQAKDASDFLDFRNGIYHDKRSLIKFLASCGQSDYQPFELETSRVRLARFEDERARWSQVLGPIDEWDDKDIPI